MYVGNWIKKWSDIYPKKTAVIEENLRISYRELNNHCNSISNFMLSNGIVNGDRIAILAYNSHKFIEIYFSAGKIGAIFVPLNWRMAVDEISGILEDCGPRILFFDEEFRENALLLKERVKSLEHTLSLGENGSGDFPDYGDMAECSTEEPILQKTLDPEDPHIIMYTSGTTGTPKGAVLPYRKTFYNALNANIFFKMTPSDVFLVSRPLFHSGGLLINSTPAFYKGATVILKRRFSTHEYLEAIERHRVTLAEPAATFLNFVLKECDIGKHNLQSLKCIFTGGERVGMGLLKEYHARNIPLSQLFGMTETSTLTWLPTEEAFSKAGSVGKSVFHGELRIVNKEMQDVHPGDHGEIVVAGPILMAGYWRKPELTAEVMENGWFHTGDLATMDNEGYIYIVDRIKDTYISGGENIHPAEVEKVLLMNPGIFDAAVYGVPDEKWGEAGMASIILKDGCEMSQEQVVSFLGSKIGKFKIPKYIEFVNKLPRTASGKIKRYLLIEDFIKQNTSNQSK